MDNVIRLEDRRKKKKKTDDNPVVDVMRASLDNDTVMRRYGITPKQPTFEERAANIQASIKRINSLVKELQGVKSNDL
jgi:ribosomal protein S12